MIETVVCPTCRRPLRVPETLLGQLVKCPACEQTFTATEDLEPARRPGLDRTRGDEPELDELEPVEEEPPSRRKSRRDREEDEDNRFKRRSRRRDDEDEDEDEKDEEDDRRGSRRRRRAQPPGKAQAVAIMTLVGGIVAVLVALVLACTCVGLFWPGTYFSLVCGILCIIKGAQLLSPSGRWEGPPTATAIMQIINVINLDLINVTLGILNLVFINDDEMRGYYRG